jgi:hypothetical protein
MGVFCLTDNLGNAGEDRRNLPGRLDTLPNSS